MSPAKKVKSSEVPALHTTHKDKIAPLALVPGADSSRRRQNLTTLVQGSSRRRRNCALLARVVRASFCEEDLANKCVNKIFACWCWCWSPPSEEGAGARARGAKSKKQKKKQRHTKNVFCVVVFFSFFRFSRWPRARRARPCSCTLARSGRASEI